MKAIAGKRYRHYKGGEYTVLAVGRLESNPQEEHVVYRMDYDASDYPRGTVWIRARGIFEGKVEHNGEMVERFSELP